MSECCDGWRLVVSHFSSASAQKTTSMEQSIISEASGIDVLVNNAGYAVPSTIEETRQYIHDFDKLAESTETARDLYDQVLKLYPDWLDPHVLWLGARAAKG